LTVVFRSSETTKNARPTLFNMIAEIRKIGFEMVSLLYTVKWPT
jgi:hypothetical protein